MTQTACFTIARNESHFLPRWVRHYGRTGADLYVLDHESDDGSMDGITEHTWPRRVPVTRAHAEDVSWLRDTAERTLAGLLAAYRTVIFAEVDEFLTPDPDYYPSLRNYLLARADQPALTATGFDVCPGGTWKRSDRYDKTLVCRRPVRWELGFHRPVDDTPHAPDPGLFLLHLHYADPEVAWARIRGRRRGKEFVPGEGGFGFQNKFDDRAAFDAHFAAETAGAVPVPDRLRGLIPA